MIKKIMYLVCVGGFSGAENISLLTGKELVDRGYEVLYCSPYGEIEEYIKKYYIEIKYIGLNKFDFINIKKMIRRNKPDLIYAVDFKVSVMASILKIPYISHLHNNPGWIRKKSYKTLALKYALNNSLANICVSDSIMNEFVYAKSVRKKTRTILNVVNYNNIVAMSLEDIDEYYDIGFVGRLCEQKDPLRFVELLNKISIIENKKYSAVMIGSDGGLMSACKEISKRKDLNIKFTGFQKNPYKYIKNCRVILMPSKWEGFGLTVVESMLLGKPVLATPVGGLPTVVGTTDRLCDQDEEFISKTIELLENESKYNETSVLVLQQAKKFTYVEKYVDLIEELFR